MKIHFRCIPALMALFILASCCPMLSVNPISEPAVTETQLEGVWKLDSEEDEKVFLHIIAVPENRMVVLMVEHKAGKALDVQQVPFHLSRLKSDLYINIDASELPADEFRGKSGYLFFRIEQKKPDRLVTAMLAEKPVIAAIEKGALNGVLKYKKRSAGGKQSQARRIVECVTITDSSANIRTFLESHPNESLFIDELRWFRVD